MTSRRTPRILVAVLATCLLSGCGTDYDGRVNYLREVGLRGIEVNNLLAAQGAAVTEESCRNANVALNGDSPSLSFLSNPTESEAFSLLVEQTFTKACLLGQY